MSFSRFEQLDDTPQAKAGQKRPREDDMDEDEDEDEAKAKQAALTKAQKKKSNKKLKVQNGDAIPAGAPSSDKKGTEKEKRPESSPEASKKEVKEKKEHKKEEKEKKKEEKKGKKEKKEQTNAAPTASTSVDPSSKKKTLAGGLVIDDAKVGTGKTAKAGSLCSMRYIGKLSSGTVFDSNTKGKPVSVQRATMAREHGIHFLRSSHLNSAAERLSKAGISASNSLVPSD